MSSSKSFKDSSFFKLNHQKDRPSTLDFFWAAPENRGIIEMWRRPSGIKFAGILFGRQPFLSIPGIPQTIDGGRSKCFAQRYSLTCTIQWLPWRLLCVTSGARCEWVPISHFTHLLPFSLLSSPVSSTNSAAGQHSLSFRNTKSTTRDVASSSLLESPPRSRHHSFGTMGSPGGVRPIAAGDVCGRR